jgi:membrane fusion protein (multidrug efflux system)
MGSRRRGVIDGAWRRALLLLVLVAAAVPAAAQAPGPPAVGVTAVAREDVTPRRRFSGRAEAIDRVELVARVSGFLADRRFDEGDTVTTGELLFVIEKAPYQAVLAQRQADLASAEAQVQYAAAQLQRGEELLEGENIPAAEVDQRRAALEVAKAKVLEAEAAIQSADLDLGYTDVTAPITGRIGRAAYSVGAYVGPASGALATIVSEDPIYVTFPVSQTVLTRLHQEASDHDGTPRVVVRAELPTGDLYARPGEVDFAEVEVDAGTDTLTIRARFANPEGLLVPGQFLNVVVERGAPVQALVIPQAALLVDQAGPYVLVVGDGDEVEQRRVRLGQGTGNGATAVVEDGLREGERIIVDGIQKVRPGQVVHPTPAAKLEPS